MFDIDIKGSTNPIDKIGYLNTSLCSKLNDIKFEKRKSINRIIKSIERDIIKEVIIKFLLLYLSDDMSTFNAVVRPKPLIDINNKNVGIIIEYKPIPRVPICLVRTIFVIIPTTLVIIPPSIKMMLDLINLFFFIILL